MIATDVRFPRHAALWSLVRTTPIAGELAHDALHVGRVYLWALRLAPEPDVDLDLAGATALVHDLVPIPKESVDRAFAGEKSARAAGPVLAEAAYLAHEIAAICDAVSTSSWSRGLMPRSPLGAILQDADRLDAIGAIGIARTFTTAQAMSKPEAPGRLYDPIDPLGDDRDLDDRRQALDHFARKLLKLASGMRTEGARGGGPKACDDECVLRGVCGGAAVAFFCISLISWANCRVECPHAGQNAETSIDIELLLVRTSRHRQVNVGAHGVPRRGCHRPSR